VCCHDATIVPLFIVRPVRNGAVPARQGGKRSRERAHAGSDSGARVHGVQPYGFASLHPNIARGVQRCCTPSTPLHPNSWLVGNPIRGRTLYTLAKAQREPPSLGHQRLHVGGDFKLHTFGGENCTLALIPG